MNSRRGLAEIQPIADAKAGFTPDFLQFDSRHQSLRSSRENSFLRYPNTSVRLATRLYLGLLLMALAAFAPVASANDLALAWLTAQFQADGSSGQSGDIATSIQSTAETLRTLQALDPAGGSASPASLAFLATSTQPANTEYLARGHRQRRGRPASLARSQPEPRRRFRGSAGLFQQRSGYRFGHRSSGQGA
jgi:hypothetical protein